MKDRALYPALQRSGNDGMARIGQHYQQEMGGFVREYDSFAHRWNQPEALRGDEQGFRNDVNVVLRVLQERIQRENHDFYPRIEAM